MATALETYQALRGMAEITASSAPKDAFDAARFLVSRVQHQVLSTQPDGLHRQLYGILFAHALHQFDLSEVYDAPTTWTEQEGAPDRRRILRDGAVVVAAILFLISCVQLYAHSEILLLVGLIAIAALLLLAFLLRPTQAKARIRLQQRVNPQRLDEQIERAMRAIDRDMAALDTMLPREDAAAVSPAALDLYAKVLELARNGEAPLPDELMEAADAYAAQEGIALEEYSAAHAALFQVLPTKRGTRTLVPAMLREETLLRSGLAVAGAGEEREA